MTGFGKASAIYGSKKIHVELRALNSKNLDLSLRISSLYHEREMDIRRLLAPLLVRGKVDGAIWVEEEQGSSAAKINADVVAAYAAQINTISQLTALPHPADPWSIIAHLPEVVSTKGENELTDEEWQAVCEVTKEAADALIAFRVQEGEALKRKFEEKLSNISRLMEALTPYEQGRTEKIRARLEERLGELRGIDYDKNRLEQELIYYIEKLDISEERQRLTNHLAYFRQTMEEGVAQGKKLGFIAQEMGREINTTGSKSNQAEMQNLVVQMKDELEQIKEQVLNVL